MTAKRRFGRTFGSFGLAIAALQVSLTTAGDLRGQGVPGGAAAAATPYDWLQFNGDAAHGGNNSLESQISPQNVGSLAELFQVRLPGRADSAPAVLTGVTTATGTRDLLFLTTTAGHVVALDAHTGATIWSHQNQGQSPTMSSPAVDPSRSNVYAYGLDGKVHKYAVGTGVEFLTGGWPEVATLKPSVEKGSGALTIATFGGTTYLYAPSSGYFGDGGDYQGHITAIDLSSGNQTVFNALCSDQTIHFTSGGSDCAEREGGVWARSGVVFDASQGRLYFVTGNAKFDPAHHFWGDTVLAVNPNGVGTAGNPLDSYTPSNFQTLQDQDLDLGSSAPLVVAGTSKYPHLAVQSGKDAKLRILNLDDLSGKGGAGNVGGEVAVVDLPQGGEVQNALASWVNPVNGTQWVYAVSPTNGIAGLTLSADASGNPSLVPVWKNTIAGGSPLLANGVLYYAANKDLRALDPTTGAKLWDSTVIGGIHWESPVVANGIVYISDEDGNVTAFSHTAPPPPPTFPVQINFQPASAPMFPGTVADTGLVYGDRGNGWTYGWSIDSRSVARRRQSPLSPDERYDTLIHMQRLGNAVWNLAVPPGTYSVRIVAGDAGFIDSYFATAAEGTLVLNSAPTASQHWVDNTTTVTVSDGALTLTNATGAINNKIDFIVVNKL